MRAKVPRRRAVEIARTREDILVAAARALGRRGFGSVSMQDIAAEVGFTAPALYAYFDSKEEIFSELKLMLHSELWATFRPPPPAGQSFRRRLSILLGRQLEWADHRRDVFLAFVAMRARGEAVPFGARAESADDEGPRGYLRAMAGWLRQAAERPDDLGSCDPDEAASVLLGMCHGFLLRWVLSGSQTRLADDTERILDLFFHGVL
ncbi:MAG TPA: helix-turn-helix domain-containing protein, partial [Kofleriaceae bacterium]|nr:helix-turn-helix domain-containing protein [Kofleriaceae bacterium]